MNRLLVAKSFLIVQLIISHCHKTVGIHKADRYTLNNKLENICSMNSFRILMYRGAINFQNTSFSRLLVSLSLCFCFSIESGCRTKRWKDRCRGWSTTRTAVNEPSVRWLVYAPSLSAYTRISQWPGHRVRTKTHLYCSSRGSVWALFRKSRIQPW